jgi:hypothetical protein
MLLLHKKIIFIMFVWSVHPDIFYRMMKSYNKIHSTCPTGKNWKTSTLLNILLGKGGLYFILCTSDSYNITQKQQFINEEWRILNFPVQQG